MHVTEKFTNIVARWSGLTHDSYIFRASVIKEQLEGTNFENGVLLGDSGYPCLPYLMTPYPNSDNEKQRRFNRALRVTRSFVERTFGVLKHRFHVLDGEVRMSPERVCTIIAACCILHNIAIDHNEPILDDDDEELADDGNADYDGEETGAVVRITLPTHISNTYIYTIELDKSSNIDTLLNTVKN